MDSRLIQITNHVSINGEIEMNMSNGFTKGNPKLGNIIHKQILHRIWLRWN